METKTGSGLRDGVSVMFADVSGFTAISERLDPEDVTDIMNRCFDSLESIVVVHGGVVLKYIGDCVMAAFGLDGDAEEGARHAALASVDIREAVAAFNRQSQTPLPSPLQINIGVATGPVIAGEVGGRVRREFGLAGETVNLASRLADVAQKGEIAVSQATWELSRRDFLYREMPPVRMSDSAEVPAFELREAQHAQRRAQFGSERRQATVMFADIVGFKRLAAVMEPEALTEVLNHCFVQLEGAVREHGGIVDKFVGECVMALFGVPNAIEDAPEQALNAAIEMRKALAEVNRTTSLPAPLDLHIGVNTGLVISGEIGGRVRRDFTVMGDAVNLASRLKDAAPVGSIYVGPDTERYTRGRFKFTPLPPLTLKNKAQPVPAFELRSASGQKHHDKVDVERISSVMVGRAREVTLANEAVLRLIEGRGGSLAIIGEAGIGKSRLLAEVLWLDAVRDCRVLEGRALSVGRNLAFHPFVDILRQWVGVREEDGDREALEKLALGLRTSANAEAEEALPFIATLMGIELPEALAEMLRGIDGDALERLITKNVRDVLHAIAGEKPLILVFEDLHWADDSSVKLLEALLRSSLEAPILFLLPTRPDFPQTSGRVLERAREVLAARHVEVALEPLSERDSAQLVQNLLRIENLPYSLRVQITRTTGGNPFFVEEVVRSLVDAGAIVEKNGHFQVTEALHTAVIPGTVQEVIMARVDRLDATTRHLVQVASVIGRSFFYSVIAEILRRQGALDETLDSDLESLKTRQLLIERRTGWTVAVGATTITVELEYVFKHALVQQTIYESLLQKTRKEFHRIVAEVIESVFAERLSDFFGMLAYHYGRAEDLKKAEDYLFKAGEEAARSAASSEALSFFQEASRLYLQIHGDGGDPEKRATLAKNLGLAFLNSGRLTECIDHFDTALRHLGQKLPASAARRYTAFAGDLAAVLSRLYLRGSAGGHRPASAAEHMIFEIISNRARALTTSDPQRLFMDNVGAIRRVNRIDRRTVEEAFGMYVMAATLFAWSGLSYGIARRFAAIADELAHADEVAEVFLSHFLAFGIDYLEGRWSEIASPDDELVERALRAGRFWDVQTYLGLACDLRLRQGRWDAARAALAQLAEIHDTYGYEFAGANHDGMTAVLLLEERRLESAQKAAEKYYGERHEDPLRILALGTKAQVEILSGEREAAAGTLATAEAIIAHAQIPPWHLSAFVCARLLYDVESLERATGSGRKANSALARQARRSARQAKRVVRQVALSRPAIYRLCGRLEWALGRRDKAMRFWERALAEAERLGAAPERARLFVEVAKRIAGAKLSLAGRDSETLRLEGRRQLTDLGLQWDLRQREGSLRQVA